jgi:hypothetical protein
MLYEFLLVSGWLFWIVIGLSLILDTIIIANDEQIPAAIFASAVIAATILFTDAAKGVSVQVVVVCALAYVVIGIIWSVWKWYGFVRKSYYSLKQRWDTTAHKTYNTFTDYIKDKRPSASENKQLIVGWMAFWPFSILWWVLTWPRKLFIELFDYLRNLYDRITDQVWGV